MITFKCNKLIRNKIIGSMIKNNEHSIYSILSKDKYLKQLKKKILEESKELLIESDEEKILSELADISEIIECILAELKINKSKFLAKKLDKRLKYGTFNKKYYLKRVSLLENSEWLRHYLNSPFYKKIN